MAKKVPDLFNTPDMAMILRIQNAMCGLVTERHGCVDMKCDQCQLSSDDLLGFADWLKDMLGKAK